MVTIYCKKKDCEGAKMDLVEEDSRTEWYEGIYECPICGKRKAHRREFDQNGLVISDTIEG